MMYKQAYKIEVLSKPRTITGIMMAEGLWAGDWGETYYNYDEFKKYTKGMIGKPLIIWHGKTNIRDKEGGKIKKVKPLDDLRALQFTAEVTDELFADLVKSGTMYAVSPKGRWNSYVHTDKGRPNTEKPRRYTDRA